MTVNDADRGRLRYEYEVYDSTDQLVATSGRTVSYVPRGTPYTWTVTTSAAGTGLPDGEYRWRGRGCDSTECGRWSSAGDAGWFSFTVRQPVAAPLPTVTSTDYPEDVWAGGPGVAGQFTFSPGTVTTGIQTYLYALNGGRATQVSPDADGTASITIVPERDLGNVLSVTAIDLLGHRSDTADYQFRVRPVQGSWYWPLDEGAGTTAASAPDNDHPLSFSENGATWSTPGVNDTSAAATFTGAGDLSTASSVLDTTAVAGFSVGAWVRLPEQSDTPTGLPAQNQTAISQDGTTTSMFRLGYRTDLNVDQDAAGTPDPAWCFSLATSDTDHADGTTACTTEYLEPGVWTHLAGVADPIHNQIRLYVNGAPAFDGVLATAAGKALWQSTGGFAVARALSGSGSAERWVGDLDEIHAVPRVWNEAEIQQLTRAL
jgi:hypothetical protein